VYAKTPDSLRRERDAYAAYLASFDGAETTTGDARSEGVAR
jgi:hypothetical protein